MATVTADLADPGAAQQVVQAALDACGRIDGLVNNAGIGPAVHFTEMSDDEWADDWPEGVARWHAAAPLGRLGTPEDIGDACVFLCSDLARWITGADLVVDGGVLTRPTW